MDQQACQQAFETFVQISTEQIRQFLSQMDYAQYAPVASVILDAQSKGNRIHITGIGKPSHVANYMASLLSSTGTPTYFLHGTEAVHGSCGQLVPGDVVICISNSGETAELKATVTAILNNGCRVIAVTGNPDSWLNAHAEASLFAGVTAEGGPLNRAPRDSILAECLALQGLSVILQANRNIDPKQYVMWHPGGTLGQLRENEKNG